MVAQKPTPNFKNCSCVCVSLCTMSYTTQHRTHTTVSRSFSGSTRVSQCQKEASSGLYGSREDNRGRWPTIRLGNTASRLISDPPPSSPPFLCQTPFLPQPSHFILAWDRYQICWLAYPVAWFIPSGTVSAQNSSDNFSSYPPDNHHSWDDVDRMYEVRWHTWWCWRRPRPAMQWLADWTVPQSVCHQQALYWLHSTPAHHNPTCTWESPQSRWTA